MYQSPQVTLGEQCGRYRWPISTLPDVTRRRFGPGFVHAQTLAGRGAGVQQSHAQRVLVQLVNQACLSRQARRQRAAGPWCSTQTQKILLLENLFRLA